jgi:single-stranded DNA-binding protein
MRNTQSIEIIGNLTAKPEIRKSNDGKTDYVRVNVAVNLSKEKVNYHTLLAFGNLTNILASFEKGELVLINGDLETSEYINKAGEKKFTSTVTLKRILRIQLSKDGSINPDEVIIDESMID